MTEQGREQEFQEWEKEQEYWASEDAKAMADLEAQQQQLNPRTAKMSKADMQEMVYLCCLAIDDLKKWLSDFLYPHILKYWVELYQLKTKKPGSAQLNQELKELEEQFDGMKAYLSSTLSEINKHLERAKVDKQDSF